MNLQHRLVTALLSFSSTVVLLALPAIAPPATAYEAQAMRENYREDSMVGGPCSLAGMTNGTAANYRWYNICSGYIWIEVYGYPDGVGVQFGGAAQPAVNDANAVKRAITYYRNVSPGYIYTVDVHVDIDSNADGCPDAAFLSDLALDPGLRWNCSEFSTPIPDGVGSLLVRTQRNRSYAPHYATDGARNEDCEPYGVPRSFGYYDDGRCEPWLGPNLRPTNFLYWLILDGEPSPPVPVACCLSEGICQVLLPEDCTAMGGQPRYDLKTCEDVLCEELRACCYAQDLCLDLLPSICNAKGGIVLGPGSRCEPNGDCPVDPTTLEACCLPDGCAHLTVAECEANGGQPMGAGSVCKTTVCTPPNAVAPTTWGHIKGLFR
jgi:hypothetical protein